jgi:hypothetical protein
MTDRWISQQKHWCPECKVFIDGKQSSVQKHQATGRHKASVAKALKKVRIEKLNKERDDMILREELAQINAAAAVAQASAELGLPAPPPVVYSARTVAAQAAAAVAASGGSGMHRSGFVRTNYVEDDGEVGQRKWDAFFPDHVKDREKYEKNLKKLGIEKDAVEDEDPISLEVDPLTGELLGVAGEATRVNLKDKVEVDDDTGVGKWETVVRVVKEEVKPEEANEDNEDDDGVEVVDHNLGSKKRKASEIEHPETAFEEDEEDNILAMYDKHLKKSTSSSSSSTQVQQESKQQKEAIATAEDHSNIFKKRRKKN